MSPETESVHEPVSRRVRLVVAYRGTAFRGFAVNNDVDTVAGRLTEAISVAARTEVKLTGAGRTDAGVHARGQVISLDLPEDVDLDRLRTSVNAMCAPDIAVREIAWADPAFDARFSARWRHYRYTVLNTETPDPFVVDVAWHVREPLAMPLMQLACDPLIGEQDFTSFCRRPPYIPGVAEPSMKRNVMLARWTDDGSGMLRFDIRANAFCHQMVRSIVGLLVDVGLGRRPPSDVRAVMVARDRAVNSALAPGHGLSLWEVGYDENPL